MASGGGITKDERRVMRSRERLSAGAFLATPLSPGHAMPDRLRHGRLAQLHSAPVSRWR
jgi:hypothetical protein